MEISNPILKETFYFSRICKERLRKQGNFPLNDKSFAFNEKSDEEASINVHPNVNNRMALENQVNQK